MWVGSDTVDFDVTSPTTHLPGTFLSRLRLKIHSSKFPAAVFKIRSESYHGVAVFSQATFYINRVNLKEIQQDRG